MASSTPSEGSCGVVGVLVVTMAPVDSSTATTSVNVPPVSMPMRRRRPGVMRPKVSRVEMAGDLAVVVARAEDRLDPGADRHRRRASRMEATPGRHAEGAGDLAGDGPFPGRGIGMGGGRGGGGRPGGRGHARGAQRVPVPRVTAL